MHYLHRLSLFLKWTSLDLDVTSLVMCILQESLIAYRELFAAVVSVITKEYIVQFPLKLHEDNTMQP